MNIQQLQYFVTTSQTLNFSRTAEEFYTSRQSVSHVVRQLEDEIGLRLFDNQNNRLQLTEMGERFAARAAKTVKSFHDLERDFSRAKREEEKLLRIALDSSYLSNNPAFSTNLYGVISRFSLEPQGCEILIKEDFSASCFKMIMRRDVDLGLVMSMGRDFPECNSIVLLEYPLGVMMSCENELANKETIEVGDLRDQNLFVPPGYPFQYNALLRKCELNDAVPRKMHTVNDAHMVVPIVRNNEGVAITDVGEDERAREQGMRVVPFRDKSLSNSICLVYRMDASNKDLVERFIMFMNVHEEWMVHQSLTGYNRWESKTRR